MNHKKNVFKTVILVIIFVLILLAGIVALNYYYGDKLIIPGLREAAMEFQNIEEEEEIIVEVEQDLPTPEEVKKEEPKKEEPKEDDKKDAIEVKESEAQDEESTEKAELLPLSVQDGKLVDSQGEAIVLRGVSSANLAWFPEVINADSIKYMRDTWGYNVIRLAMYTSDYNGYCVSDDANRQKLLDKLDEAVEAATDSGMYVIIDWHILNDSNPLEYKEQSIQFFGQQVRKYADYDNVIYEICNEPNGNTTWQDITAYANEVIPVIRNVDKDAVVLVGTPTWCQDILDAVDAPLDFENVMYTYHFYSSTHGSSNRSDLEDAVKAGLPVFVSEFGISEASGDGNIKIGEAKKWIKLLNDNGISACMWNLSNKAESSALLDKDTKKTSDWTEEDLSEAGKWMLENLAIEENEENDN